MSESVEAPGFTSGSNSCTLHGMASEKSTDPKPMTTHQQAVEERLQVIRWRAEPYPELRSGQHLRPSTSRFSARELRRAHGELVGRLMGMLYLEERWSLREVGSLFGLSYERVRQRLIEQGVPRRPAYPEPTGSRTAPLPEDVRRVRELTSFGMSVSEGFLLLGYKHPKSRATQARIGRSAIPRAGGLNGDYAWRGWKERWMLELGKIIATDALQKGATIREASEVSGLKKGSVHAWTSTGVLPRSKNPQGNSGYHPPKMKPEDVSERDREIAMAWNVGMTGPEIAEPLNLSPDTIYSAVYRMRDIGIQIDRRR